MIYDNVDIHAGYLTARIKTTMPDQSLFLQAYVGYRLTLEPNSLAEAEGWRLWARGQEEKYQFIMDY